MLDVALFDLKQDRTGLLQDRGRQPILLLGRQTDHRIRRDQNGFLAAHQKHAAVAAGPDGVTRLQDLFLRQRSLLGARNGRPDFARRFADPPDPVFGRKRI
jgi:hypothetical protein